MRYQRSIRALSLSSASLLATPVAALALCLAYPAQGRHAVIVTLPGAEPGRAAGWLVNRGASIAGSARGSAILRMPSDTLALEAAAAGVLLLAVPGRDCTNEKDR